MVGIAQAASSDDLITGVTYGGEAMTRLHSEADTAGEPGRTYLYFLGSGIPTGAQTIAVDVTSGTDPKAVWGVSVTASADTESAAENGTGTEADDPSVTLATTSDYAGVVVAILYSGLGLVSNITAGDGYTKLDGSETGGHDFGVNCCVIEHGAKSGENVVANFVTSASDDTALCAAAIAEVAGGTAHEMAGVAAGVGSSTGALSLGATLAGVASGAGVATGALQQAHVLAGTSTGTASVTGAITLALVLAGVSAGAGSATATLDVPGQEESTRFVSSPFPLLYLLLRRR